MEYRHITGYKFVPLADLTTLRNDLLHTCQELNLLGTILISPEGININLTGTPEALVHFNLLIKGKVAFSDISFKTTLSDHQPYKRLLVKIKKEIITFKHSDIDPQKHTVKNISPLTFKQWLDNNDDIVVIDTRNEFEVLYGTFDSAINLHIQQFTDFTGAIKKLNPDYKTKPVVIFCTGGVRCEKAGPAMEQLGYENVYQLEGGIINYFAQCKNEHFSGECFVFDDRVTINPQACDPLSITIY